MNITSFFALSNKPTSFFRCITPNDGRGTAPRMDFGISPPTNNPTSSIDDNLAIDAGDRQKAIMNRLLLDSEAVARKAEEIGLAYQSRYSFFQVSRVHGLCQSIRVHRLPLYFIKLKSAVCNPASLGSQSSAHDLVTHVGAREMAFGIKPL